MGFKANSKKRHHYAEIEFNPEVVLSAVLFEHNMEVISRLNLFHINLECILLGSQSELKETSTSETLPAEIINFSFQREEVLFFVQSFLKNNYIFAAIQGTECTINKKMSVSFSSNFILPLYLIVTFRRIASTRSFYLKET